MVAPTGIGKAATTVAETAGKAGGKTAGKEQIEKFDKAMAKPDATATQAAGQAGTAGVQPAPSQASAATGVEPAAPTRPGDKILKGIDGMRNSARKLVDGVQSPGDTGIGPAGSVAEMLDTQKSLIDFEVTTQVGGKGVQETNQAVQTLLKGQ